MNRDELTQLFNAQMPDKKSELCRDMFCLRAAFGCRIENFLRLKPENINNGILEYYMAKRRKDDLPKLIKVPVSERAKTIINKYNRKSEYLLPFLNESDYNELLKFVFKIAKLDRTIITFNRDKGKKEHHKLYELASSHLARRTFIDILCQAGEPIPVVASMSWHSERSKAFDRYRRRPEGLQKQAVLRSMD